MAKCKGCFLVVKGGAIEPQYISTVMSTTAPHPPLPKHRGTNVWKTRSANCSGRPLRTPRGGEELRFASTSPGVPLLHRVKLQRRSRGSSCTAGPRAAAPAWHPAGSGPSGTSEEAKHEKSPEGKGRALRPLWDKGMAQGLKQNGGC